MFAGENWSSLTLTELVDTGPVCTGGVGVPGLLLLGGVGDVVSPPPPPQAAARLMAASARILEPNRMSQLRIETVGPSPATIRSPTDAFPAVGRWSAKLSLATASATARAAARLLRSAGAAHVLAIVLDHLRDVLGMLPGLRPDVGDRAAESYVIANDVHARRIFQHVFDIRLAYSEVAVDVSCVVRFVTF